MMLSEYLNDLVKNGTDYVHKLTQEQLSEIVSFLIKETPTRFHPSIERSDPSNDLSGLISGYIDHKTLESMERIAEQLVNMAVLAWLPEIEDRIAVKRSEFIRDEFRSEVKKAYPTE